MERTIQTLIKREPIITLGTMGFKEKALIPIIVLIEIKRNIV